jgi:hypothetical protein
MSIIHNQVFKAQFRPGLGGGNLQGMAMAVAALVLATLALSGCAGFFAGFGPASGPGPNVANCRLIQQATPALYVCDGKTYTATQLYDIRHGKEASPCEGPGSEQSSGSSSKPNTACKNVVHYF